MTASGLILYGPPGSGKDTVTDALTKLHPEFALFERLKAGPGRTTGYRLTTTDHIERLDREGALLYRNARYGAEYAIDRPGVSDLVQSGRIPILHMGQVAGAEAVQEFPLRWNSVILWCPKEVTHRRCTARGDKDVDARLKVWEQTRQDLLSHSEQPWSLTLRTDRVSSDDAAHSIYQAVSSGAPSTALNMQELMG